MSTLQFLREKAGVLVVIVIGLSLFIFVISDFFGSGRNQSRKMRKYYEIGEISGESVSYQEYETRLQNLTEIYKMSGTSVFDESMSQNMREQVWQQIVREKILDPQYEDLGIGVSNEEVDDLVLGNNTHPVVLQLFSDPETGAFNKSFLVNFLKQTEVDESARRYWLFFEDEIVNDRLNTKYNVLVSKGLYVTSKQAEFDKMLTSNSVDFSYVVKNYASIPDSSVTVTNNDLQDYYDRNKESYRRTALRDIEYVIFDVSPSEEDINQTEEWIIRTKEEFKTASDPEQFINLSSDTRHVGFYIPYEDVPENLKSFVKAEESDSVFGPYLEDDTYRIARLLDVQNRPDSVHVRHILLGTTMRSVADAREMADSLIKQIKSGTPFEALAVTVSDDQGSAQLGGDLGWFQEGMMVVPFNNASFSAQKGEITTAETTFGVHIIEVLDRSKPVKKYNIGIIDRRIIPGTLTTQNVYSEASQFAGNTKSYEDFNQAIAEQKLNKRIATDVSPQQNALPGLESPRMLVMSLFNAGEDEIILDNSNQAVFEIDNRYVVAYCTRIQEEGLAPLEDVENDVRFAVVREKKAEVIAAEFKKQQGSLDDIAGTMNLTVQEATGINFRSYSVQGVGVEPALIAAASAAEQGELEGPVEGVNGVFMFVVNNTTPVPEEENALIKDRLQSTFQVRGTYEAFEALRKKADVKDSRYKFY